MGQGQGQAGLQCPEAGSERGPVAAGLGRPNTVRAQLRAWTCRGFVPGSRAVRVALER